MWMSGGSLMSEGGEARDHNGERGPIPTGRDLFPWQTARAIREYLDALKKEMERLEATRAR